MSFFMSDVEQFRPVKCNKRTSNKKVTGYKSIDNTNDNYFILISYLFNYCFLILNHVLFEYIATMLHIQIEY